jgi:CRP-like cAMP-binding protein
MTAIQRPPNGLLQALSAEEFDTLRAQLSSVKLVRETVLVEAGAAQTHVFLPHSGAICMMVALSEGQTVEVATLGRNSVVGATAALGDGVSLSDAVVLFSGTATALDVTTFRAAVDRSAALRNLLARHEQALLAQAQQLAACNASHPVEARLSRWLLRAHDLCDGESLLMTQEFLARMIGVQRNSISIVAHGLQHAGIIRYSRGRIDILDVEALRQTACECYQTVKAQHHRLLSAPE